MTIIWGIWHLFFYGLLGTAAWEDGRRHRIPNGLPLFLLLLGAAAGIVQGGFDVAQGGFGVVQGGFDVVQGGFDVVQGGFDVVQEPFCVHAGIDWAQRFGGMLAGSLPFLLAGLWRPGSLGGGDWKLLAAAGFCLGIGRIGETLLAGFLLAALWGIWLRLCGKRGRYPIGPCLCAGILLGGLV